MINWKVELSNGEVLFERINFEVIEGEKSPWLRLLDHLEKNKLEIVDLSLSDGKRTFNLPGPNSPKFRAFMGLDKPEYKFFRMIGGDIDGDNKADLFAVIEAKYGETKLQLWVDESTNNCWCIIK